MVEAHEYFFFLSLEHLYCIRDSLACILNETNKLLEFNQHQSCSWKKIRNSNTCIVLEFIWVRFFCFSFLNAVVATRFVVVCALYAASKFHRHNEKELQPSTCFQNYRNKKYTTSKVHATWWSLSFPPTSCLASSSSSFSLLQLYNSRPTFNCWQV